MAIDLTDPHQYDDFLNSFRGWDMKFRKAVDLMHEGSALMQMNKSGGD